MATMNASGVVLRRQPNPPPPTGTSGVVVKKREVAGFVLTQASYAQGLTLAPHRHADAYLSLVLNGTYVEKYAHRTSECSEGSLRFLPSGEVHENHFLSPVETLLVRIEPAVLARLGEHAAVLSSPGEVSGLASSWLANRMLREFHADDDLAPLAIEGVLLEVLAESARTIGESGGSHAPGWLRRVREALEEAYLNAPSLTELAAIAGVHPVHLSREFRKHYQTTIGEYIRKRRVERASELLTKTDTTLSEIAQICGFSDQSHFSAMFKSFTGLTPAKFRDLASRS